MARLTKDSLEKIEKILKLANSNVHSALKEVHARARKSALIVKKELDESGDLRNRSSRKHARDVSSFAEKLWEKSSNLQNNVYKDGAKGLEIHSELNELERDAARLDMMHDSDKLFKEIVELKTTIGNARKLIAKTGFVEGIETKPKEEKTKKNKVPQRIQDIIGTMSSIVEDENVPELCLWRAKAYLGRMVKACHTRGEEYEELIKNDFTEAEDMLETVISSIEKES